MITSRIKSHQKVVHNFPLDLSQNCLFMAFTPPWVLDWESDQLPVFYLCFLCVSRCRRKPWRACKGTDLPAFYRKRGSYLSKGCTLSISFLAIHLINGPDHTLSPQAVTRHVQKQAHTDCPSSWLNPKSQSAHRYTRVDHMAPPLSTPGPTAHDLNTQSS